MNTQLKTKIKPKWQCGKCDEIHDYECQAEDCCPTEVHEIYICPVCDMGYDYENEAVECCADDTDSPVAVTQAELEAAGQLRLELRGAA